MHCHNCGAQLADNDKFCKHCGTQVVQPQVVQPQVNSTIEEHYYEEQPVYNFIVWKVVSGILSIVIFVFMMFQTFALNIFNALTKSDDKSGSVGLLVAFIILTTGITSIVGRKSKGANIAIVLLAGFGAFLGFHNIGIYADLVIWTWWLFIMGILALFAYIRYEP